MSIPFEEVAKGVVIGALASALSLWIHASADLTHGVVKRNVAPLDQPKEFVMEWVTGPIPGSPPFEQSGITPGSCLEKPPVKRGIIVFGVVLVVAAAAFAAWRLLPQARRTSQMRTQSRSLPHQQRYAISSGSRPSFWTA